MLMNVRESLPIEHCGRIQEASQYANFDEHSYRMLFRANPHPMYVLDLSTWRFLAVNDAATTQYGYSEVEFLSMTANDLRSPEEGDRLREFLYTNAGEEVTKAGLWVHRRKGGTLVDVDVTFHRLAFRGNAAVLVLAMDVTEQLRAVRERETAQSKFQALVEQSLVGVFMIDLASVVYANPRAEEVFGYGPGEMVKKPFLDFIHAADRPGVLEEVQKVASHQIAVGHAEFSGIRKDGSTVLVGAQTTLARGGDRPLLMGVLQDITEKRRLETAEKDHLHQLERTIAGTADAVANLMELRDPYTAGHERRVGEIAAAIAQELGWNEDRQQGLRIAGRLHDVGKIVVPAEILTKPGRLTAVEFELIKSHAERGYEVLKGIEFTWPVAEVAWQHHERLDGSGYPRGLRGDEILLEARILAVADVVESMSSHRPYRPALGLEAALAEIGTNAGRLYDKHIAEICVSIFRSERFALPY
jgi:PAS domain S-box-containing protein